MTIDHSESRFYTRKKDAAKLTGNEEAEAAADPLPASQQRNSVSYLNVELILLVRLVAGQFGLVGLLVCLQILSMLSDVGPGPHATDALDVDLHDAVERVLPPAGRKHTLKPYDIYTYRPETCDNSKYLNKKNLHVVPVRYISVDWLLQVRLICRLTLRVTMRLKYKLTIGVPLLSNGY